MDLRGYVRRTPLGRMEGRPGDGGCPRSGWHVREPCVLAPGSGRGCRHGVFSSWRTSGEAPVDPGTPGAQAQAASTILFLPRAVVSRLSATLGTACSRWSPASPWPPRAASGPSALYSDRSFPAQTVSVHQAGRLFFDSARRDTMAGHLSSGHGMGTWPL